MIPATNFSNLYFGKDLYDLTMEDLRQFFESPRSESDKIEFKSYPEISSTDNHKNRENKILKSICGFLNSEGGLIIWGAPTGTPTEGSKEEIFHGKLTPLPRLLGKDGIVNKMADSITPAPHGVNFQPIEETGEYVYVIQIPPSPYSPHQFQSIYYMRLDGQTRPAPHHYVEALFSKAAIPQLSGFLIFGKKREHLSGDRKGVSIAIKVVIFNLSRYLNERELGYSLETDQGEIREKHGFHSYGPVASENNAKPIFYYGEHASFLHQLNFPHHIINLKGELTGSQQVRVSLSFGGILSPLKRSTYLLQWDSDIGSHLQILEANVNYLVMDLIDSSKKKVMIYLFTLDKV